MLNLYQSVSSALGYITDIHELLGTIVGLIPIELHCEECSFLSYDINNNEFEFFSAVGETGNKLLKERFPANKGIAGRAVRERKTFVVNNVQNNSDFYRSIDENYKFKTKSIVAAPAILAEETFGVIEAINKVETEYFNIDDDQILSAIADVVALAVKNSKMFDYFVDSYCKIRQGANSCEGCKRPLKSWTPCAKDLGLC
jgi:GAF domain-containing protein